jgi:hypothetical protein
MVLRLSSTIKPERSKLGTATMTTDCPLGPAFYSANNIQLQTCGGRLERQRWPHTVRQGLHFKAQMSFYKHA